MIVNALTRLRFCTPDGAMEFETKDGADAAAGRLHALVRRAGPPDRATRPSPSATGRRWAGCSRPDLLSLDTGCVWGGCLSAVRIGATLAERELIQVHCAQAQKPG